MCEIESQKLLCKSESIFHTNVVVRECKVKVQVFEFL